jgi:hypothetical protein
MSSCYLLLALSTIMAWVSVQVKSGQKFKLINLPCGLLLRLVLQLGLRGSLRVVSNLATLAGFERILG